MVMAILDTAAQVARPFGGLTVDYDVIALLMSFAVIAVIFGAVGGMAHHFVIVLQYKRPMLRGSDGSLPEKIEAGKDVRFVDGALAAAAFVGIASAAGFVFFIIAMLGIEKGFDKVMAVKVMSLSVIAGFAGRTLLTAMASNVTKQYVDTQVDAVTEAVLKRLDQQERQMGKLVDDVTKDYVDSQVDAIAEQVRTRLEDHKTLVQQQVEEIKAFGTVPALELTLSQVNQKLILALEDPAVMATAITQAEAVMRPQPGRAITVLWINYARALKFDGRIGEAVQSLIQFVDGVLGGRLEMNSNYAAAVYNLACYTSLLAEKQHGKGREKLLAESRDFLAKFMKMVDYDPLEVELASHDGDLKALRATPLFEEVIAARTEI